MVEEQLFPTSTSVTSSTSSTKQSGKTDPVLIQKVWDHYLLRHHFETKKKPMLTEERIRLIDKSIRNYGVETLINAITGCTLSPWHMGHNPNNRKYNSIELILRNTEKIETFEQIHENNETGGGFL
jgi:hypothetical protein